MPTIQSVIHIIKFCTNLICQQDPRVCWVMAAMENHRTETVNTRRTAQQLTSSTSSNLSGKNNSKTMIHVFIWLSLLVNTRCQRTLVKNICQIISFSRCDMMFPCRSCFRQQKLHRKVCIQMHINSTNLVILYTANLYHLTDCVCVLLKLLQQLLFPAHLITWAFLCRTVSLY